VDDFTHPVVNGLSQGMFQGPMPLEMSALDALIGGFSAAFFGGLVAAMAYLLQRVLALKEEFRALEDRVDALGPLEEVMEAAGDADGPPQRLKGARDKEGT
jgi:hypothetical protein